MTSGKYQVMINIQSIVLIPAGRMASGKYQVMTTIQSAVLIAVAMVTPWWQISGHN